MRTDFKTIFSPEDFSDEHRLIADTVSRFVEDKIYPRIEEIEAKKEGVMGELLVEAGELGLLGADIPEEYGGISADEICSVIIAEKVGATGSFATAQGVHSCLGSLPIVFFGNEEQKSRYLPALATAEKVSAYALTEADSGSDALAAKTRAVLSSDGRYYVLNGGKTFISNAGIADIFIVYAKIDGERFTAFIVDADLAGLSTGEEERKMGLRGSSTRSIYFDNVQVPIENLLHEPGKGHEVAFNILNIGRHKVSAQALGAAKHALELAASYANERKQFNRPLAQFGLVQEKLAEMAIRIYAAESTVYRTGGLLLGAQKQLDLSSGNSGQLVAKSLGEYTIECSLEKVFVTEMEAFVVDEAVQVHGGYGFISEYAVERLYRDSRVKRIFEGTNEINRILITTTLFRRGATGQLPLFAAMDRMNISYDVDIAPRETLGDIVQAIKDVCIFLLAVLNKCYGDDFLHLQEILGRLADIAIQAYTSESVLLRTEKSLAANDPLGKLKTSMATAFIYQSVGKTEQSGLEIIESLAEGSKLQPLRDTLGRLLNYTPVNKIALRGKIAEEISAAGKYIT